MTPQENLQAFKQETAMEIANRCIVEYGWSLRQRYLVGSPDSPGRWVVNFKDVYTANNNWGSTCSSTAGLGYTITEALETYLKKLENLHIRYHGTQIGMFAEGKLWPYNEKMPKYLKPNEDLGINRVMERLQSGGYVREFTKKKQKPKLSVVQKPCEDVTIISLLHSINNVLKWRNDDITFERLISAHKTEVKINRLAATNGEAPGQYTDYIITEGTTIKEAEEKLLAVMEGKVIYSGNERVFVFNSGWLKNILQTESESRNHSKVNLRVV